VLAPLEILAKANKRVIGVLFLTVLAVGTSCVPDESAKQPARLVRKTDVLTVFLTGNELGALKPCGCSGGQLGGLDRRPAVFNSVPRQRRLIVDTGWFVEGDSEQDLIKFQIIIQALSRLDYDLVNLAEKDIEIAQNLGLLDSIGSVFNIISSRPVRSKSPVATATIGRTGRTALEQTSNGARGPADVNVPAKFTRQLSLKNKAVAVTVAAFDTKSGQIERIGELFVLWSDLQTVNILILNHSDAGIIRSIAERGIVDCLVCPAESDEAMVIGDPNERPLVVSVGRYGKYVGKLQIRADEVGDKLNLSFLPVDVNESLSQEASLLELYKAYQELVKESNLLEKQPRFVLPNGLKYTGSESCKPCHEYEYEKWSGGAHAHAYATLERVGSQFDPECVVCHVVGMKYESGFVSAEKTGHLKNVGCESCHGPGSEHISVTNWASPGSIGAGLGKLKTSGARLDCADCHTPETSGDYGGNEELYFEKIIHWREPNAGGNVK